MATDCVFAFEDILDHYETIMLKFIAAVCLTASMLISANCFAAEPVNHADVLAPFIDQDTFAVVYADIAALGLPKEANAIVSPQLLLVMQNFPAAVQAQMFLTGAAEALAAKFRDAGGQGIYVLAGLGDLHIGGGPVMVATTQPGRKLDEVEHFFRKAIKEIVENPGYASVSSQTRELDVQQKGSVVLVGMKGAIARYAAMKSAPRNDLTSPLARLAGEGAIASVVFCPGADFRRVVRELWPELPGALAPLKGDLADRWPHLEAAINGPPKMSPRLALYTSDPESAATFVKLWNDLPIAVTQFGGNEKSLEQARGYAQVLVDALPAKTEGTRAVIQIPVEQANLAKLGAMFGGAINAATESSNRRERLDRFRQIASGMTNYEDTIKCFPPAVIRDKGGKPLLSWRVDILPWIGQEDLYNKFHLNEAWDSPHNRALIEKMPDVYMDLGAKAAQTNHEGKTTVQVPVGPQTIFDKKEGTRFSEIKDGTSRTILLVEVEPSKAVVWTKPDDWEVDLKQPRKGLERADRGSFAAAFADGHCETIDLSKIDDTKLRSFLTRAGGEDTD